VADRRSWKHVIDRLRPRHRCIAYDQRGYGETTYEPNRLEAWLWLDGPSAPKGRVSGPARELFLDMNDRALRADDPGPQADQKPAWTRLGEITAPAVVMVGELDRKRLQRISDTLAASLPDARAVWLPGVAHLPHLEGDPATLDEIADLTDRL
jgi:pimeloyl-ACP methyl ester carboxylesterase